MPAPSCPHDSMQSTVGGQGRMLCERYALGRHAEGRGDWAGVLAPRPRAAAHMAIRMLGHPYAQEPALLARFTREGRAAAGLSHPNIVAGLRQRLRDRQAPSGHEGVEAQSAATAPASRCRSGTIRPAARPASWSPSSSRTPTSKSGGRSTASARSWNAAASSAADVLTGRAAPAPVGAAVLRNPVTRAVRWLTRFHGGRHGHSIPLELLASQMRRAVAEAAKS
jgi:hypothetical protein